MSPNYEINKLAKEESWRMFRILGEFVDGFDVLSQVEPAITIYGSARVKPEDKLYQTAKTIARGLAQRGFSILTGGGPGIMEAANQGALEAGANSVGLHIRLPTQENINPYTTISITFKYFFVRKVMLVKYASAFILMPGGWGTLDELFETITLIQTQKIKPFPVILYDSAHWQGLMQWMEQTLCGKGFVSHPDLGLFHVVDEPEQVFHIVEAWQRDNLSKD
ncbi:MAG: TIGR00730 family Rossman fold protein [Chloroflexota bacterium]